MAHEGCFYPPIACVNYGNSPLADGSVTCFAQKIEGDKEDEGDEEDYSPFRLSVMNQGKDWHSGNALPITKLNTHAKRCADAVLNGLFGSVRLLCVSAPGDNLKVADPTKCKRRYFIPYELTECCILKDVMEQLTVQRSKDGRIVRHATYFTEQKERVTPLYETIDD